jgi:hypothetical protein
LNARKPQETSVKRVPPHTQLMMRVTMRLPTYFASGISGRSLGSAKREQVTKSASPSRIGRIRASMSEGLNCPSPSMLTITSAPRRIARSRPTLNTLPKPGRLWRLTTSAPDWAAVSAVPSVEPSFTTMISTSLIPAIFRGTPATTLAMVACSF